MHIIATENPGQGISCHNDESVYAVTHEEARIWIGCQLILKKSLLGYEPGMVCTVMCVVDFGDGPLLWIVTDDKQSTEVDQIEVSCVADYFMPYQANAIGTVNTVEDPAHTVAFV